jgi:hypothetical protein
MSNKEKQASWLSYVVVLGLLVLGGVLCMPLARAICNVPPYGEVSVDYADPITGTKAPKLYVGLGCTNSYDVTITSNAPMQFKSDDTNIFMFVSNAAPTVLLEKVVTSNSIILWGVAAGTTNMSTMSSTNSGEPFDITCGVIEVTCVDFTKLTLTNTACSNGVVDTTLTNEAAATSNTLC